MSSILVAYNATKGETHSELVLNKKEAARLLDILKEELDGPMYDVVFVAQSRFGRFTSWFWKNDIDWQFSWGDALRLRAYLMYKLGKGIKGDLRIDTTAVHKMPLYRKVD
jgi:hypothetical protein